MGPAGIYRFDLAFSTIVADLRNCANVTSLANPNFRFPPMPAKQPAYRQNRTHKNFLTNLNLPTDNIKETLKQSWNAAGEFKNIPWEAIERLARERYSNDEWNFKF